MDGLAALLLRLPARRLTPATAGPDGVAAGADRVYPLWVLQVGDYVRVAGNHRCAGRVGVVVMRLPQTDAPTRFSVAFDDGSCEVLFAEQLQPEEAPGRHLRLVPPLSEADEPLS